MPNNNPFKPKVVGRKMLRGDEVTVTTDSLIDLRHDLNELQRATDKRISDLEKKVRELTAMVEERRDE